MDRNWESSSAAFQLKFTAKKLKETEKENEELKRKVEMQEAKLATRDKQVEALKKKMELQAQTFAEKRDKYLVVFDELLKQYEPLPKQDKRSLWAKVQGPIASLWNKILNKTPEEFPPLGGDVNVSERILPDASFQSVCKIVFLTGWTVKRFVRLERNVFVCYPVDDPWYENAKEIFVINDNTRVFSRQDQMLVTLEFLDEEENAKPKEILIYPEDLDQQHALISKLHDLRPRYPTLFG